MLNIIYIELGELDNHTENTLWNQGVNMDDWDYMLVLDEVVEVDDINIGSTGYLYKLLQGCCDNVWYHNINLFGKNRTIGIAYHS